MRRLPAIAFAALLTLVLAAPAGARDTNTIVCSVGGLRLTLRADIGGCPGPGVAVPREYIVGTPSVERGSLAPSSVRRPAPTGSVPVTGAPAPAPALAVATSATYSPGAGPADPAATLAITAVAPVSAIAAPTARRATVAQAVAGRGAGVSQDAPLGGIVLALVAIAAAAAALALPRRAARTA